MTNNIMTYTKPLIALYLIATNTFAQNASDFMNDFPPSPEARVTNVAWSAGPQNRWTYQHIRELMPTIEIDRGIGPIFQLPETPKPITEIQLENLNGEAGTIAQWLETSYTDGFLVLHKGSILSEVYMNDMTERSKHIFFSMSKPLIGNLAGILIPHLTLIT